MDFLSKLNPFRRAAQPTVVPKSSPPKSNKLPPQLHSVNLSGQLIPFVLTRTRRASIGMIVDANGLRVRASPTSSMADVEHALQSKTKWILAAIDRMNQAQHMPQASFVPSLNLSDGDVISILGRPVVVQWRADAPKTEVVRLVKWLHDLFDTQAAHELVLRAVPMERREKQLANVITIILRIYIHQTTDVLATAHGLRFSSITLSNAKTLWGTCRSDGALRFNARLVFLDKTLVDYVIAHELSHTVHMNHSRMFWQQVKRLCPDYKVRAKALKHYNLRAA